MAMGSLEADPISTVAAALGSKFLSRNIEKITAAPVEAMMAPSNKLNSRASFRIISG